MKLGKLYDTNTNNNKYAQYCRSIRRLCIESETIKKFALSH